MKNKVILTQKFGLDEVDILKDKYNLVIGEEQPERLSDIVKMNSDAEVLIPFLSDRIDRKIIDMMPELKIIANYAVGYNNIDYDHAGKKGVFVTNTPGILTDATADLTLSLILSVARRILESDKYMRSGQFTGWGANLMLGKELRGMTLGIIGMGKIGREVALRARAFGMKIIYYSRSRKIALEEKYGFENIDLRNLIMTSDVISPHIPYSTELHHLFNGETFRSMKKGAIFINVSRGGLMDEEALADVLDEGHLFGAGLDVFENEPEVNLRLTRMDNVVMTPHTGSATDAARTGMARIVIKNVEQVLNEKVPENLIPELKNMLKY